MRPPRTAFIIENVDDFYFIFSFFILYMIEYYERFTHLIIITNKNNTIIVIIGYIPFCTRYSAVGSRGLRSVQVSRSVRGWVGLLLSQLAPQHPRPRAESSALHFHLAVSVQGCIRACRKASQ